MRLLHIGCRHFRNLSEVQLAFAPKVTVFIGNNGQGKTNLLEAVFFLTTQKPLRAQRLREFIEKGATSTHVELELEIGGAKRHVSVKLDACAKQLSVDGKRSSRLAEVLGPTPTVAFTPEDVWVIKGAPSARRLLLDNAAANRFPAFSAEARSFQRTLKSRNRLLKERLLSQLEVWNESLARWGARIWVRRRRLLEEMQPRVQAVFSKIGPDWSPLHLRYVPLGNAEFFKNASEEMLTKALLEQLGARQRQDVERGYTSVGPHSDELGVALGELEARTFASQGQTRAFALAWKVAEVANLESMLGMSPVLLLDDVSSELDPERNAFLMHFVAQSQTQVLLTTTSANLVQTAALGNSLWYQVCAGNFKPMAAPG
ncbi:MAG: DNA replication and repair protein RecF [Proteobacteria bacterium]|nr:DNA replication and repair protein RecF [Cystobacterineae bacterium]MCL2259635.1 DNA replication and repair protein RecF [Cystobacterineae bacterium]MCL2313837.1 DNA replication and repair protein RecF [Pseudomonadota bacterium]